MKVERLIEHPVLICCGSGGVGKTSVSAALAMLAARSRRTLVATIDPARRLATAMGIGELRNEPRKVVCPGLDLHAMMLDTKKTFDSLIEQHASPEVAKQILGNRFYQSISSRIAGTENYMAMEKLFELHQQGLYETIVLDTPPSRHALDFLDAPANMQNMLQGNVLKWIIRPYFEAGRLSLGFLRRGADRIAQLLDEIFGLQFLHDLSDFFRAFMTLYDGFRERSARVLDLLHSGDVGFVVVAAPSEASLAEAAHFRSLLETRGMNFLGFIVNRVHVMQPLTGAEWTRLEQAARSDSSRDFRPMFETYLDFQGLAAREEKLIAVSLGTDAILTRLPVLEEDIHDLQGLRRMGDAIETGRACPRRQRKRKSS